LNKQSIQPDQKCYQK